MESLFGLISQKKAILKQKSIMNTIKTLKLYLTDEQILECLILFENRKMDAAKMLCAYLYPKRIISTLEGVKILTELQKEI